MAQIMQPINGSPQQFQQSRPPTLCSNQMEANLPSIHIHSPTHSVIHSFTLARRKADHALTRGREAPRQSTGQLARADETHAHGRRIPANADPETLGIPGSVSTRGKGRIRTARNSNSNRDAPDERLGRPQGSQSIHRQTRSLRLVTCRRQPIRSWDLSADQSAAPPGPCARLLLAPRVEPVGACLRGPAWGAGNSWLGESVSNSGLGARSPKRLFEMNSTWTPGYS